MGLALSQIDVLMEYRDAVSLVYVWTRNVVGRSHVDEGMLSPTEVPL